MKIIPSILLCATALTGAVGAAQAAPPNQMASTTLSLSNSLPAAPDGDRFLFVVDHSSSMKRLSLAARETVVGMIFTGFDGRMTNGDTYGIWTASAKPQIGVLPMQVWDGARPLELASLAGKYLRSVPNEGRANFTDLLTMLHSVVTAVGDLNIFIITDGETPFKGSPADAELNQQFKDKGKDARRAGKPLIVTLATREGRMAGFSVTVAGDPITLPPRPPRLVAKPTPASGASTEKRANRSIVITNAPPKPVVAVEPPPPAPVASIPPALLPAAVPSPEPAIEKAAPPVSVHQTAAHHAPPPPAPAPVPIPAAPVKPEAPAATPANTNAPAPAPEEPDRNPPTLEKIPLLEPPERPSTYRAGTPSAPQPAAAAPGADPSRFATLLEKKMLVFARESGSNQPPSPLPGPAAAVPMASWNSPMLLILGSALLLVALVLLWLILRHQRRTAAASLISRSMDRR
jgi:hypothetical protein